MDLSEMESIVHDLGTEVRGGDGVWEFSVEGVRMACITDVRFDRMRVIAPICQEEELSEEQRKATLEANFHTALDARYATSDGVLYSAFIHPLNALGPAEFRSALEQVSNLVETFGTTYCGGTLVFGGTRESDMN